MEKNIYPKLQFSCGLSDPGISGEVRIASHVPFWSPEGKKEKMNKAVEERKWMKLTRN